MNDETALRLAARLTLLETLMFDVMLNIIGRDSDALATLGMVRKETINKIRFRSTMPPDSTLDADVAMRVQAETAAFAERYFDQLEVEIRRVEE